ncbi:amidohydrolase family protein [Tenacibaculum maritimum]|uniref:amidohydrolase family protein n=1 Tax=Tenacibaculum maritimum TaxID=107401 RepID=UPI0012E5B284|nr:amidohydrolase family protein [Tenacibaculum maritimum]CAA0226684.1 Amidohydrolase family protein [Tenacibaculum maritimum]
MKNHIFTLLYFFLINHSNSQQVPAPQQSNDYSIEGGIAHLGNGKIIENSLIIISKGKIHFIGSNKTKIARQGTVINAKNKHIYPGFIAANTTLGLGEIDAVKASRDEKEIGTLNPHIRSIIAYNAESRIIETMRPNGVLIAQTTPRGGLISGTSSIVQLDAWNWEDAILKQDDAIHVNWPSGITYTGKWWMGEPRIAKSNTKYIETIKELTSYFEKAKNYLKGSKFPKNLPFEALKGLFINSQKLFIHVDGEREIVDAITFSRKQGIRNMVIVRGKEAYKVSDLLLKYKIPVILERAHRLPPTEDDDYDLPFKSAKILADKGILVGLGMGGEMERMSTRNLPFYAGTYAAYGLGKEEALKMITANNAKILGISDMVGTLEKGKDATLFISKGDALDMRTNKISFAFINGRKISLESHQTALWKRYTDKHK